MPVFLGRSWQHSLWRLALWYALALVAGFAVGRVWLVLAVASVALVAWHYWRLLRLIRTLASRRWQPPPQGWGLWSELEALLHRRQRESRQRKRRLLAMLRAFREAAAALPDATVVLDRREQRILWFNEAAVRLLGLRYPDDLGARLTNLVRAPRVLAWLQAGAEEPLMDVASPVDEAVRLSLRWIPYAGDQALLVARDISKLTHLEQVRRDFVANVSHELRTPLTVVHGYLDLFEPEDMPEWKPMLLEMRQQSQRMTQIVEDLLTISRLEARESLPDEHVDMASMLATLRREARALSQGRHEVSLVDGAGCDLLGSPKELHSAFSNLVSNAVRYTPEGGRIEISLQRDTDGVQLCVSDTGPGIPPQHIPRLTERFYRVSTSRSRDSGGTGLGLAIVKHVLNLHQARLLIDSELGRGSRFCCRFAASRVLPRDGQDAPAGGSA